MVYTAEISRRNPACFIFIVDQSYSMIEDIGSQRGVRKADFVADVLNKTLQNLVIACSKNSAINHYFDTSIIGYGGQGVGPAFTGPLANSRLVSISDIGENPAHFEVRRRKEPDGVGGIVEYDYKMPIWFEPAYTGGTPMYEALELANNLLVAWTATHRESFPPVVLHVTDGDWNTSDPSGMADSISSLGTADGNVLLFNLHVSTADSEPVLFPASTEALPSDKFAHALFQMSSTLTPQMVQIAQAKNRLHGIVRPGSRGYIFNGGIEDIVDFFDIGTRPAFNQMSPNP